MESLNSITLVGRVGMHHTSTVGDKKYSLLSVMTEYRTRNNVGEETIEITWFTVRCFGDDFNTPSSDIKKGDIVKVEGRMRSLRYTSSNGDERVTYEVIASNITKIG